MIEKSLETGKNIEKENESLMWTMIWLIKINSNIDNQLNHVKNKIVDLRFVQPLSIPEILAELQIADDYYYRALSISKDDGFKLHLKRNPDSCFVNNYFNDWLKAKQANMDIQLILNEYKAVTYMWSYISKCEDCCSQVIKKARKKTFEKYASSWNIENDVWSIFKKTWIIYLGSSLSHPPRIEVRKSGKYGGNLLEESIVLSIICVMMNFQHIALSIIS